jgi:hypothetical protein
MSSDTAKKRKVAAEEYDCGSVHTAVAGVEDIIAEMKAHMMSMQNEMNSMRERLSNVEKLESKAASMQNEMQASSVGSRDAAELCDYSSVGRALDCGFRYRGSSPRSHPYN